MNDPASRRTAIARGELSRPARLALNVGVLGTGDSFFDYGCGRGYDIFELSGIGIRASGWDPNFRPDVPLQNADVVNIGYVLNVISDANERREALLSAWRLAQRALVVAARLNVERRTVTTGRPYGDGFMTSKGTFQRFYSQGELRTWIDLELGVESIAIAPGVFLVFREEKDANEFLMRNRRRRTVSVTVPRADHLYNENKDLLDRLVHFFTERGRLPAQGEDPALEGDLHRVIGSIRRCWSIVEKAAGNTDWSSIADARRDDLLVDLALLKLNRRPNFSALPPHIRLDVRTLCGSYKEATGLADSLLFSAGDLDLVDTLSSQSIVGKRLPGALYVHESALALLAPVLRVYEGCARWLVGDVEGCNIIKLATDKPKVSYLAYPTFDRDPHPALVQATYVRLRGLEVDSRNYGGSSNPPILHRKEQFVAQGYELREKFARLTAQEERLGLLGDDTRSIGNREGWLERLREAGFTLRGHRVVRMQNPSRPTPVDQRVAVEI
jgi:DNA phosphorothioation-associated putative methyltransferase